MILRQHVYSKALDAIESIYDQSKHSSVDFYRIKDIINSVNNNQFNSKQWLIDSALPHINHCNSIFIAGSWYGLLGLMLSEVIDNNVRITLCDVDPVCQHIAKMFISEKQYPNIKIMKADAVDHIIEHRDKYDCIINTSCEHMEKSDVRLMMGVKDPEAIAVLQSNNYDDIDSHINTSSNINEFIDYTKLKHVLWSGTLETKKYDRYMVIGK